MRNARLLAFLLCLAPGMARAESKFYLEDGDRVVFHGDSITEQRLYSTYVETYVVTRFPERNVTFVNSGWNFDRVTGGDRGGGPIDLRLRRDVFAHKPTVVTIMLGMNDAGYRPFDPKAFQAFAKGYEHIVEAVKSELPDIRLTLIRPSPFDDVTRKPNVPGGGYNAVLVRYGAFIKELAEKSGVDVADLNTLVVAALEKAAEVDPTNARKLIPDRIHPGPGGALLLAGVLLKTWNAPATVTRVELEIGRDGVKTSRQENTKVTLATARKGGVVSWMQDDAALPFPVDLNDPTVALAAKVSDFLLALDQEVLKVAGLDRPEYTLAIDDEEVGMFTKAQLAEGVNLAGLDTPMARQAAKVHKLTIKHHDVHHVRWRQVEVPWQDEKAPHLNAALKGLDALEADVVAEQRATAQPVPHRYELRPKS